MVVRKIEGLEIRPTVAQYAQVEFIMDLLFDDVDESPSDIIDINSIIATLAYALDERLDVASYLRWGTLPTWFMSLTLLTRIMDPHWGEDRMIYGKMGSQKMLEFHHGGAILKLGIAE